MRILLTILLFIPLFAPAQWIGRDGEYAHPMRDPNGKAVIISENLNLTGNGGAGVKGIPQTISTPGITFTAVDNTLHGSVFIGSDTYAYTTGGCSQGECGLGNLVGSTSLTKVATDARGLAFLPIKIVQGTYIKIGSNDAQGLFYVKTGTSSDTVFYSGARKYGMGANGTAAEDTVMTPTIAWSLPSGQRVSKMCGGVVVAALLNDGTVWTWGANGTASYLGRTIVGLAYATPGQVTGFDDSVRDIVGGTTPGIIARTKTGNHYHWGPHAIYVGWANDPAHNTPTLIMDSCISYMLNGTTRTSIMTMGCNSHCFHFIPNDSTLWGSGDNGMGSIGNGIEPNMPTQSFPWNIDPAQIAVLPQIHPVQVTKKHNYVYVSSGCLYGFTTSVRDINDSLFFAGRNKGGIIPDGIIECSGANGDIDANYPNSWDRPNLTPVSPYAINSTIGASCPGCKTGVVTSFCSECTIPTTTPSANAGSNQSITTSTITLDGSGSTCTGGKLTYYLWTQVSGSSAVIDVPAAIKPNISGLTTGTYIFKLTVTDNGFNTSNQNVTITVSLPSVISIRAGAKVIIH